MYEQSLKFVNQLMEKTEQGKISWTTAVFDGQFKAVLPGEGLTFVVQAKTRSDGRLVHKFQLLDDHQEEILNEVISGGYVKGLPNESEYIQPQFLYWDSDGDITPQYTFDETRVQLFQAIGKLQELARTRALRVNEKLITAEAVLARI